MPSPNDVVTIHFKIQRKDMDYVSKEIMRVLSEIDSGVVKVCSGQDGVF